MIPGDLLRAFPHRQFHTLPGLLDSWAALPNSNPNALRAMQGGSLYHFHDGFCYDPAGRWTHGLLFERRTRYRLSQPDWANPTQSLLDMLSILICEIPPHYLTKFHDLILIASLYLSTFQEFSSLRDILLICMIPLQVSPEIGSDRESK